MKDKFTKLINVYKKYGIAGFFKKCWDYFIANYVSKISFDVSFNKKKYESLVNSILSDSKYDKIIIWRSSFGYDGPLYQRPQHIANNLAKLNTLVFYEVTTMTDNVKTIKNQKENLYLVNFNNKSFSKILFNALKNSTDPKYIQIYSTDWRLSINELRSYIIEGYKIIYEYIDDLSAELSGTKDLPKNVVDKYNYAMQHDDVYIVVTAENLKQDVIEKRGDKNLAFSSNGVDYEFFKTFDDKFEFDEDFKRVLDIGKPIICYYGALAKWFDYELIKKIDATDKYSIVLFGVKYDEAYDESGIDSLSNVHFLGSRDYKVLKNYAKKCDIMTIPFVINDITEATSPVKIFEYMALHKPIVITDLKECRQYKSVMIGHNHEEFIELLEKAVIRTDDKKYINLLDKEAKENDWSYKARAIVDLIERNKDERCNTRSRKRDKAISNN